MASWPVQRTRPHGEQVGTPLHAKDQPRGIGQRGLQDTSDPLEADAAQHEGALLGVAALAGHRRRTAAVKAGGSVAVGRVDVWLGGCRLGVHVGEGCVEHFEQSATVELEAAGAQFQGIAVHQFGETGRQLVGGRHPSPFHQDGDDPRAASISSRTKSLGLSRRARPCSSVMVSHRSPINARSTSQEPTAVVITSTKSSPSWIESTSLKIWPRPYRSASRSKSKTACQAVSSRR
jgi:hypothetical protein